MIDKNLSTSTVLKQKFSPILWYFLFKGQIKNSRKTVSLPGRLPYMRNGRSNGSVIKKSPTTMLRSDDQVNDIKIENSLLPKSLLC